MNKRFLIETFPHMRDVIEETYERSFTSGDVIPSSFLADRPIPEGTYTEETLWQHITYPNRESDPSVWECFLCQVPLSVNDTQTVANRKVRDATVVTTLRHEASIISDNRDRREGGSLIPVFVKGIVIEIPLWQDDLDYLEMHDIAEMAHTLTKGYMKNHGTV